MTIKEQVGFKVFVLGVGSLGIFFCIVLPILNWSFELLSFKSDWAVALGTILISLMLIGCYGFVLTAKHFFNKWLEPLENPQPLKKEEKHEN